MKARNPDRIPLVLLALQELWENSPDERLGQLISNTGAARDIFNIEDDEWLRLIEDRLVELKASKKPPVQNRENLPFLEGDDFLTGPGMHGANETSSMTGWVLKTVSPEWPEYRAIQNRLVALGAALNPSAKITSVMSLEEPTFTKIELSEIWNTMAVEFTVPVVKNPNCNIDLRPSVLRRDAEERKKQRSPKKENGS